MREQSVFGCEQSVFGCELSRQLEVITAPEIVARILKHLEQREAPLIPLPARAPPELSSTKAPAPQPTSNHDKHKPFDPYLDAIPKDK